MYFVFLALSSCMCFNVKDGQYSTKTDLSDAPTCSLGRGSAISTVGQFIYVLLIRLFYKGYLTKKIWKFFVSTFFE
jgi:hypothetical protein